MLTNFNFIICLHSYLKLTSSFTQFLSLMTKNLSSRRPGGGGRGGGGDELSSYLKNTRNLIKSREMGGASQRSVDHTQKSEKDDSILSEDITISSESFTDKPAVLNHTYPTPKSGHGPIASDGNLESWMNTTSEEEEEEEKRYSLLRNVHFEVSEEEDTHNSSDDGGQRLGAGPILLTVDDIMSEKEEEESAQLLKSINSNSSTEASIISNDEDKFSLSKNSHESKADESINSNTATIINEEVEEEVESSHINNDMYSSDDFEEELDDEIKTDTPPTSAVPPRSQPLPRQPDTLKHMSTQTEEVEKEEERGNYRPSFLLPPYDSGSTRTTPLLPHIVRPEALEGTAHVHVHLSLFYISFPSSPLPLLSSPSLPLTVLTSYSPAMIALNDLTNAQLVLMRRLVDQAQNLSESLTHSSQPDHHYVTLDETKEVRT